MERNMDESRKAFEAEMAKLGDCVDMRRAKNGNEEYMAWDVSLAWKMWQASREAIEIELPKVIVTGFEQIDSKLLAAYMGLNQIKQVIRAAGIKVKE